MNCPRRKALLQDSLALPRNIAHNALAVNNTVMESQIESNLDTLLEDSQNGRQIKGALELVTETLSA